MSRGKKLAFAAFTVVAVLGTTEVVAQVVWRWLESRAFATTTRRGEAVLRNDAINFIKVADGHYGYTLKPGFTRGGLVVNDHGFAQREKVALERSPGTLRLIAMGESTTQGHDVDTGNYPTYLRQLLKMKGRGFSSAEVLNAGVAGWVSDQIALRAQRELAAYKPDIVILYVGWNDFQSYDPYGPPPRESFFQTAYGARQVSDKLGLKSIELMSAAVSAARTRWMKPRVRITDRGQPAPVRETYRFFLGNLDRIVAAYQSNDPHVKVAICTLVGRWPQGTWAEYAEKANGRTWWMKHHELPPTEAAAALDRFNDMVRQYAGNHGLLLIDAAEGFATLDRARLQWDFAHMHADGYELLAEIMYRKLLETGAVQGERSGRLKVLTAKYARHDG